MIELILLLTFSAFLVGVGSLVIAKKTDSIENRKIGISFISVSILAFVLIGLLY